MATLPQVCCTQPHSPGEVRTTLVGSLPRPCSPGHWSERTPRQLVCRQQTSVSIVCACVWCVCVRVCVCYVYISNVISKSLVTLIVTNLAAISTTHRPNPLTTSSIHSHNPLPPSHNPLPLAHTPLPPVRIIPSLPLTHPSLQLT